MDIEKGKNYWIVTKKPHSYFLGKNDYIRLKYCTFKNYQFGTSTKQIESLRFYQHGKDFFYSVSVWQLSSCVFKTKDDYLYYLLKKKNKRQNYTFDDFLKQKIKESQQNYPEKWI